jgi:adenosylcobalamin-dependent ribonucleoside-triphosphate reductase
MNFKLKEEFINKYRDIEPDFGFNGLGKIAYLRSYSRLKEDNTNEEWFETIRRVVEGTYSIQKDHILKYELGWDEEKGQQSAEEMYDRIFNMKFLPPGRGLYAMGSDIINKRGLYAALNNCAFVSTENIDVEFSRPFEFMMDFSMLGVGVGFDVKGADKVLIKKPIINTSNEQTNYTIPDDREGWVTSLKLLIEAYLKGLELPIFNYSLVRPKGAIIRTFGGKSAGAAPLRKLHKQINHILSNNIGNFLSTENIVDIMNMIGVCVIAGNVRRSAQIVFGDPKDKNYLKLKDYHWNEETGSYVGSKIHRAEYGWTSNNSIFAELGQNYNEVATQTSLNGEPGYYWLENAKKYSRMNDVIDNKDHRASGGNPCLEQTLESYEMCCLVEIYPTRHESLEDFKRSIKFAYLYAKTVTLGNTHWVETNRVQLRNRRIGTSISGVTQFLDKNGIGKLKEWLEEGYKVIQHYDNIYSEWLAIPKSIKTTSIKPSGTVSLLAGATPGIHYPESNYYIRRIRISINSDLIPYLIKAGYKVEPDVKEPNDTMVIEIPVSVEGVRTIKDVSMWEQLSLAAFVQKYWSDNQVSCTITFNEQEKSQIPFALNYFQYQLKGISFLPKIEKSLYEQMPYEEITKEKYDSIIKDIKPLVISKISEKSVPEKYCNNDSCQIL